MRARIHQINSLFQEYCPGVSPDGKYFFFSSDKRPVPDFAGRFASPDGIDQIYRSPFNGLGDVYWVDIKFLEPFRQHPVP